MPPEINGFPIVDGAHKLAAYYAAQADVHPRLEDAFGWLLYAACGDVSTVSDVPESGLYTHYFRMSQADYLAMKWLTVRRSVPAPEGGAASGEQSLDTRVSSMVFNFPAAARVSASIGLLGRIPSFSDDVSGWTYAAAAEDSTSVAITSSTNAYYKLPTYSASNLPSPLIRVTLGNTVTQPQDEFIVGSPYPDDLIGLYRAMSIEAIYNWQSEALYHELVAAGGTGASIAWSPVIYESDFRVKAVSNANITGKSNPYSIEIYAQRCFFWPTAGPEIAGLNLISLPLNGVVARPASGDAYQVILVNDTAGYIWPS